MHNYKHELYKHALRMRMRTLRCENSGDFHMLEILEASQDGRNFLQQRGKVISGYYPLEDEFNILPLLDHLSKHNQVLLPKVMANSRILGFGLYTAERDYGFKGKILEPTEILPQDELKIDIMLVPALGIDGNLNRIGYGGGYYDTSLKYYKKLNPALWSIGVCFSNCYLTEEQFTTEAHDQTLAGIITEQQADINIAPHNNQQQQQQDNKA